MAHFICATCGTQYPETDSPPQQCLICADERQYIGWKGQQWTTLDQLRADHHNTIRSEEANLTGIGTEPSFAIGQRALLVAAPGGNVLWDCITLIDEATIEAVKKLGGISAIAISHPHFYSAMVEWSRAFHAPVYLHAADRQWVMRPDPPIVFWEGDTQRLGDGLTLIRCGGHFAGSTVLHWAGGAEGRGALLAGDTVYVANDRRWVSFMYSFPNLIPLSAPAIDQILKAIEPYKYDRIYGAWFDRVLEGDAPAAVSRSADRYGRAVGA